MNKVILAGFLGRNPELKRTQNQVAVCSFSVATSEKFKNAAGEMQDKTEWHRIVAWNALAENCNKFLAKGSQVLLEGKIQTRKYKDKNEIEKSVTEIIASNVQFLNKIQKENSADVSAEEIAQGKEIVASSQVVDDDDIPF